MITTCRLSTRQNHQLLPTQHSMKNCPSSITNRSHLKHNRPVKPLRFILNSGNHGQRTLKAHHSCVMMNNSTIISTLKLSSSQISILILWLHTSSCYQGVHYLWVDFHSQEESKVCMRSKTVQFFFKMVEPLWSKVYILEHDPAPSFRCRVNCLISLTEAFRGTW